MRATRAARRCGRYDGYLLAIARRERRVPRAAGENAADVLDGAMDVMSTGEAHARDRM